MQAKLMQQMDKLRAQIIHDSRSLDDVATKASKVVMDTQVLLSCATCGLVEEKQHAARSADVLLACCRPALPSDDNEAHCRYLHLAASSGSPACSHCQITTISLK
jgi:hypothetical protein